MTAVSPVLTSTKLADSDLGTHYSGDAEIEDRGRLSKPGFGEITDQPIADPPAPSMGTGTVEDPVCLMADWNDSITTSTLATPVT